MLTGCESENDILLTFFARGCWEKRNAHRTVGASACLLYCNPNLDEHYFPRPRSEIQLDTSNADCHLHNLFTNSEHSSISLAYY